MVYNSLLPFYGYRPNHHWDVLDWPQTVFHRRWDPFDDFGLVPSVGLVSLNKRLQDMITNEASVKNDKDGFQVKIDVNHYSPEEITVKAIDNNLVIHGKHEEKSDSGFVSREFTRRYAIPENCCLENIKSSLSSNGILTIEAPKKAIEDGNKEKPIPVTIQQQQQQQDNKLTNG